MKKSNSRDGMDSDFIAQDRDETADEVADDTADGAAAGACGGVEWECSESADGRTLRKSYSNDDPLARFSPLAFGCELHPLANSVGVFLDRCGMRALLQKQTGSAVVVRGISCRDPPLFLANFLMPSRRRGDA